MNLTERSLGELSLEVFNTFVPSNIEEYLSHLLQETDGDVFYVQQAYHHIVATRFKLYTMQASVR
eukprot:3984490-Alexandrium_andersonii.AAC.1